MDKCYIPDCGKKAQFICNCGNFPSLFCRQCSESHAKQGQPHDLSQYYPPTKEMILSSILLQLQHCEQEVIKITNIRLKEINDQSKKTLKAMSVERKRIISLVNTINLTNDIIQSFEQKINDELIEFYKEVYKYTLEEERKPDMMHELPEGVYTGKLKDDKPDGPGVMFYKTGDSYEGEFRNGKPQGLGIYNYSNGSIFKGEFNNGKKEGHGECVYNDGSKYSGQWKEDIRCGYGILFFTKKNQKYEGKWENNQRHGKGIEFIGKERYEGEWENNEKNGLVIHFYENGTSANEVWINGKKHMENQDDNH
ncbi:hypothetical protein SteCoe_25756 [Stentor coeruleus]|uniref:Uncharacterized protein n=1 Tax=Stentor coeruleus TaxID=5963 RepID=A0A1R2BEI6_9CILI|nr:hypothetical protein SteCoe_25756 [Stentor coeruleus]